MNGETAKVSENTHVIDSLPVPFVGLVTPQRLLAAIGFTVRDAQRALMHDRRALRACLPDKRRIKTLADGKTEETVELGGAPDWDVRHRAAEHLYDLAGLRERKRDDEADPSRPVAIQIIVHPPGDASTQRGVTLSFGSQAPLPIVGEAQKSLESPDQESLALG